MRAAGRPDRRPGCTVWRIMWMVRAGRGGVMVEEFLLRGIVGITEDRLPELSLPVTKDALLKLYEQTFPEAKPNSRLSWASQLLRLLTEVAIGDEVIMGDPDHRRYLLGRIESDYVFVPGVGETSVHGRRVKWDREAPRDQLSTDTRNTLGSVLTVFRLNPEAEADVRARAVALGAEPTGTTVTTAPAPVLDAPALRRLAEETFAKADEFIEDQINALSPYEMQDLVAGLLRAMGYRTTVADPGPDRGVDVFASPDGLGLQDPRIFVEVKHRVAQIGAPQIRTFVGGRRPGDRCLYVSTGGFSKEAYYEAERSTVAIRLITLPQLRQLVVDNYDRLDTETRSLVPLRKYYWPIGEGERG